MSGYSKQINLLRFQANTNTDDLHERTVCLYSVYITRFLLQSELHQQRTCFILLRDTNGVNIMASYIQGYDEERFVTTLNRNFICLICFNVLKDPVLCPRNQHCFCRGCITKHLENAKRCPTCADELTVETLIEAPRMIKDILNELNIRCLYSERGCQEILQLQHLERHEATCGFTPAVCTNQGCGATYVLFTMKARFANPES